MLKNEFVELKPISNKDTEFVLSLRNNIELSNNFFSDPPVYDHEHNNWLNKRNSEDLDFIILNSENVKTGRIIISNLDFRNQKCEYGIMIHPHYQRKGYGYQASSILIEYVFTNLPINKIFLEVFEKNNGAKILYEKLGFINEGLLIEEYYKCGVFQNTYRMALLKNNWLK